MKHFHKLLAALALVAATVLPCHASDAEGYSLAMYTADGTRTVYTFSDHPMLTISGSTFTVTTHAGKASYAAASLRRFALEDSDGQAVDDAYWLVVSLRDGTIEAYPFTDRPSIIIKDGKFSVVTAARTVDYAATSIERFRVTDDFEDNHAANADVNGDGAVNVADIGAIIDVMAGSTEIPYASADVNGDGNVDVADIGTVISVMASGELKIEN